jgi:RNA polymerase sigma factor (sigma-70 family)
MRSVSGSENSPSLESLAGRAAGGSKEALAALVERIQHRIYRLALRMLYHPVDAEDATQEILIKIVTRLGSFEGRAAFSTWSHRIACNHLLTTRRRRAERREVTFQGFEAMIDASAAPKASPRPPDNEVLIKEMRIACLQGMLLCLDREHRIAFVLAEVFDVSSGEAADILGITPAAYRKRLSRARSRLHGFLKHNCGLIHGDNRCHCAAQVPSAVGSGLLRPERILFADHPVTDEGRAAVQELSDDLDDLGLYRRLFREQPHFAAPSTIAAAVFKEL